MIGVVLVRGVMVRRPPEGQPGQAPEAAAGRSWPASSWALAIYLFFATRGGSAGVARRVSSAYPRPGHLGRHLRHDLVGTSGDDRREDEGARRPPRSISRRATPARPSTSSAPSGQARGPRARAAEGRRVVPPLAPVGSRGTAAHAPRQSNFRTPTGASSTRSHWSIRASNVKDIGVRNRRLLGLSSLIRDNVGPSSPLGAPHPLPAWHAARRGDVEALSLRRSALPGGPPDGLLGRPRRPTSAGPTARPGATSH